MVKKIKIGLSRSRLFDFQNVVSFVGEVSEAFDLKELNKALRMLSVKEPLIASVISLDDESDAYLQPEKIQPVIEVVEKDVDSFLKKEINKGIDFNQCLFKFFVANKNTLIILSHTVVSDSKSLLILAKELLSFYNKESVDIEPEVIKLFSEESDLPLSVDSFVADRVTEVLDNNYLLKPEKFTYADYSKAKEKFSEKYGELEFCDYTLDAELCDSLKAKCIDLKVDFSSVILFALAEALSLKEKSKKKMPRINLLTDRRPFFIDRASYSVGCFNGNVSLDVTKSAGSLSERVKSFHDSLYKKACVCFNTFYNELFLSKLTPAFLDSCFMYKAGVYQNKHTKKLATLYGCEQQFLLSFESQNLNQKAWEKLSTFHHIRVKEPHKSNFNVSFSLIQGKKTTLVSEWNSTRFSKDEIDNLVENAIEFLKKL
ncbi:MAG: hypothetical protein E7522_06315 [Ruminococcaceae bacterium]|nr:hypothetical protein [Oscillospiraceae bacterium]